MHRCQYLFFHMGVINIVHLCCFGRELGSGLGDFFRILEIVTNLKLLAFSVIGFIPACGSGVSAASKEFSGPIALESWFSSPISKTP